MSKAAHKLVAQTAKEMAGELYDCMMQDNTRYAEWQAMCPDLTPAKLQRMFIAKTWPVLVPQARATLARMLATNIPEQLKQDISNALILDNTLRVGRLH